MEIQLVTRRTQLVAGHVNASPAPICRSYDAHVTRSHRSRRRMGGLAVAAGVVALFALVTTRSATTVGIAVVACCGLLALAWPWRTPQDVSHWAAQESNVRDGRVIVYWRPGCPACLRLRTGLGRGGRFASWVDIWADDEAAAFVRDLNDGNETVPTVILADGSALTNPAARRVRAQLRS